jgi:hypothetical protein
MMKRPISPFLPKTPGRPRRPESLVPRPDDLRRKLYGMGDLEPESFDPELHELAASIRGRAADDP